MLNLRVVVLAAACAIFCSGCAKDPDKDVHREVMIIKKQGEEKKQEVADPLEQGVKDDSPIIHYEPER